MASATYVHFGKTPASALAPSEPRLFFEISKEVKGLLTRVGYYEKMWANKSITHVIFSKNAAAMIEPDAPSILPLRSASVISTVSVAGWLFSSSPLNVKDLKGLLTRVGHQYNFHAKIHLRHLRKECCSHDSTRCSQMLVADVHFRHAGLQSDRRCVFPVTTIQIFVARESEFDHHAIDQGRTLELSKHTTSHSRAFRQHCSHDLSIVSLQASSTQI